MPVDAGPGSLTWQPGVPTTGITATSATGDGVDNYLSNDVTAFAELYRYTGDQHYFDVAKLLINNSFSMLALPGRLYGLKAPGWSYEYWSLTLGRGTSGLNDWAAWVGASMLHGLLQTEHFDPQLYARLATR